MLQPQDAFIDVRPQIAVLEPLLHQAGCPVARLCFLSSIYPSAWVRWKQGKKAKPENWQRVLGALEQGFPAIAEELRGRFPAKARLPIVEAA